MKKILLAEFAIGILLLAMTGLAHATSWQMQTSTSVTITQIEPLLDSTIYPTGFNDAGQVIGYMQFADGGGHAFVWDAITGMTDLSIADSTYSSAFAINNAGQIAGYYFLPDNSGSHGYVWDAANGMTDIGTLGGSSSSAGVINNSGLVGGDSTITGDSGHHAFIWQAATGMTDLGTLGGATSSAYGLNDLGQVVGVSGLTGNNGSHAFLWDAASGMTDLGTLGDSYVNSFGYDINDAGQVVGRSSLLNNSLVHAFLWDADNGMTDLGTMGGTWTEAMGINNYGQVVGYSTLVDNEASHPYVWENGMMYDLNDFITTLSIGDFLQGQGGLGSAWINNLSQILVQSDLGYCYIMTPGSAISNPTDGSSAVPEPAAMLLMGTGLIGLIGRRRKKVGAGS